MCEDATLNAFVVRTLADAAELAHLLGDTEHQQQYIKASLAIRKAINEHLWDEKIGSYSGGIKESRRTSVTVHAAAICLYFDVVPKERRSRVQDWFLANIEREKCHPYVYSFYFEVLATMDSPAAECLALDLIRRRWGPMAQFETKTTWEGFLPGENCHEGGASPTVYLSRHVLGVRVDGRVADHRIAIRPRRGNLKRIDGIVATEFGPVSVCYRQADAGGTIDMAIEAPPGVTARVFAPRLSTAAKLFVDGQAAVASDKSTLQPFVVDLTSGRRILHVER